MKEKSYNYCKCPECEKYNRMEMTEAEMHLFVGGSAKNFDGNRDDFEIDLAYTNIFYWDVSHCGFTRYCIYRDDEGKLLGWFDNYNELGFKLYKNISNSSIA